MRTPEQERLLAAMTCEPRPTPFVGAGFSAAVTDNAECATWLGLLQNGIDRCKNAKLPGFSDEDAEALGTLLRGTGINNFLTVADHVSRLLRDHQGGNAFRSWIDGTVGKLNPGKGGPELITALCSLASVIVTTNYDRLIEELQPEWSPSTWTDDDYAQATRRDKTVVHLHGIVGKPESIILGNGDYQQLKGIKLNQVLSRALFAEHVLVFIGCGAGLGDPNIAPLIKFMDLNMPEGEFEHYILMTDDEVTQYNGQPISSRITAVGYGPDHKYLLPFLKELAPAEKAAPSSHPSTTREWVEGGPKMGMLAHAKAAEQRLRDAQGALGRVGDAIEDVERILPAPTMGDWSYEKQETEHEKRAGALSGCAQQLEICSKEALGAFRAVEDDVSLLIEPRFAVFASRLGRIAKETDDLDSEAGRLLIRAAQARDEAGGRIVEYDGYRASYETLSRAHAAIEQARGTTTRLYAALTWLPSDSEPRREDQGSRTAGSAEPQAPPARQREPARSGAAWRIPIAGSAAAGPGNMSAESEGEFLLIPPLRNALKRNVLAVRVDGDSMTGDDMLDGDYVIIDKARREPRQGEIAVVRKGPSVYAEMVVKHVWREDDGFLLRGSDPEGPLTKVPGTDNPDIEGLVIGVFRPASYRSLRD
jgi:SOS-response transcriptional repressor LexA